MISELILFDGETCELRIDPAKTIIWTGAGISSIAPSCLPLGNDLTDAFLSSCLGPKWKELIALWNNYFPSIKESIKDGKWTKPCSIGNFTSIDVEMRIARHRPRLEYIIGELNKMDRYFNAIEFSNREDNEFFHRAPSLDALKHFSRVEPCIYHHRLADLIRAGAIVVTANYDNGIEKALGVDAESIEKVYETTAISDGRGGYIYHFHGIATDSPDHLGATIGSVSRGLSESFQKYLKQCFADGYNIVFIGYGGVDFFDVEPFFKDLEAEGFSGKAIYLHYSKNIEDAEANKKRAKTYTYLLNPFDRQYIAYGETDAFFHAIYSSYVDVETQGVDCGAFRATEEALNQIAKEQVDEDTYYFINMFRLCSQLNINPGRFYDDWIDRIKRLFDRWDANGMLGKMTISGGQKNDGIIEDIYSNNWHERKLTELNMSRKLRPYIRLWNKNHTSEMLRASKALFGIGFILPKSIVMHNVNETVCILENDKRDEHSIDISRGTVRYLCGWQTKMAIIVYMISFGKVKRRLYFLKSCIDRLLEYPFTRFVYSTHYLSLCRQQAYIETALHNGKNGYEGDIQKEWDICMQMPNLYDAGRVINARLHIAKLYGFTYGVNELKEIRERIWDLRKAESSL